MDTAKDYFGGLGAKLASLFKSRKFWALAASLVAIYQGHATGGVDMYQSLQLAIAALGAYSIGTGIEASKS